MEDRGAVPLLGVIGLTGKALYKEAGKRQVFIQWTLSEPTCTRVSIIEVSTLKRLNPFTSSGGTITSLSL